MTFEEFQNLARLSVIGGLDEAETAAFEAARLEFGAEAELYLKECRQLASIFALSLQPQPPKPQARQDLLARIQAVEKPARRWFH